jgi:uncharacterized membrane protein
MFSDQGGVTGVDQGLEAILLMLRLAVGLLAMLTIVVAIGLGVIIHLLARRRPSSGHAPVVQHWPRR